MPIRWKLTLWYSSILLIILLLFGTSLYLFFAHQENRAFDRNLYRTGQEVVRSTKVVGSYPLPLQRVVLPNMDVFATPDVYLQAIDTRGNIISRSRTLGNQSLPLSQQTLASISKGKEFYETISVKGTNIRIFSVPLILNNRIVGLLQVGGSLQHVEQSLSNLRLILGIGGLFTIIIAGTCGWFLARRGLRPIDDVVTAASGIQQGQDLKQRIDYQGPADEIGLLIEQFNRMLSRLDQAYEELNESYLMQKRFVSDASHELRTPLTSIRGNIDFLEKVFQDNPELAKDVLHDVSEELARMTRLMNDLLALARADAGFHVKKEEINIGAFFHDMLPQLEMMERTVPLKVEGLASLERIFTQGNPDFLKQLFFILFENAFKYTTIGEVTLSFEIVQTQSSEEQIHITVRDQGMGIPEQDLPHIFERFYRASNAQGMTGTGLGLPVAKWIVEQHQGKITVAHNQEQGTAFLIALPVYRSI